MSAIVPQLLTNTKNGSLDAESIRRSTRPQAVAKKLGRALMDRIGSKDAMYFATVVIVSATFCSRRGSLHGLLDGFQASTRRL